MTTAPRPGWYPDPAGAPDRFRWWDGGEWTEALSGSASSPPPRLAETDGDGARRPRSALRVVVALVLVVALFVAAGAGVGLWLWGDDSRSAGETGPAGAGSSTRPATSPVVAGGHLDQASHRATINDATMTLPDRPYDLHPDPLSISGVLDVAFMSEAVVHADYNRSYDWSAMVALTSVSPSLVNAGALESGGPAAMQTLLWHLYGKHPTKVLDLSVSDQSVDGHPGVLITASVHYHIAKLPSRHDTFTAQLVRLDDGVVVAAISSVPNDADPELTRLAAESMATLRIR